MRNTATTALFALALASAAAFTGACKSTTQVTALSAKSGFEITGTFREDGTLDYTSSAVKKHTYPFSIQDIRGTSTDGFRRVQVYVRNEKDRPVQLQARFFWVDRDGMEIDPDASSWKPMELYSRGTRAITEVARSPRANGFRLYIRPVGYSD